MRDTLLGGSPGQVRRRLPALRGGSEDAVSFGVGFAATLVVILYQGFISTLEPNEYGLIRNYISGSVGTEVQRGGIHFTGPFQGYVRFPAAQLVLEFSAQSPDRRPIVTRTGADPHDPDSGGQPIAISCAIQFEFLPASLRTVYLSFGSYEAARQRYLLLSGNMVSNTAQDFVPTDFWTRRDVIAKTMLKAINETFWRQGSVVATRFEIMKVDFADKFEESITAIQVAEQQKVVNEYEQQVQQVVQSIEVLRSENNAMIANISAGADATAKELCAAAQRDAFQLKQGMKAKKYAQLQKRLGFTAEEMQEFFKVNVLQSQKGKVVVGLSGLGQGSSPPLQAEPLQPPPARTGPSLAAASPLQPPALAHTLQAPARPAGGREL